MADLATQHSRVSPLRDFVNRLQAAHTVASGVSPYARAGLHTLRAGGTSLLTGGALGLIDGKWGLDVQGKYPADGILALAAAVASLALANDPDGLSVEARSVMSVSAGIFAFRKGKAFAEKHKAAPTHSDTQDSDEDPILAAARGLDQAA
jgi:hypothetical protein